MEAGLGIHRDLAVPLGNPDAEQGVVAVVLAVVVIVTAVHPAGGKEGVGARAAAPRVIDLAAGVGVIQGHIVQNPDALFADLLAVLRNQRLLVPVAAGGGHQDQISGDGALGHHIAVDIFAGIVAVGGVEGLVAVVGQVGLLGAEPAGFHGGQIEGLAAVQTVGNQRSQGALIQVVALGVQDGVHFQLVAGVVGHHDGELGAEAGDVEGEASRLAGHVVHFILAHDDAVGAEEQDGCDVLVVPQLQIQIGAAVLGAQSTLQVALVLDLGDSVVQSHLEGEAVIHHVVAVVHPGFRLVDDLGAVGQLLAVLVQAVPDLSAGLVRQDIEGDDHAVAVVVVGLGDVFAGNGPVDLAGFLIGHGEADLLGVAVHTNVDLHQGVGVGEGVVLVAGLTGTDVGVGAQLGVVGVDRQRIQAVAGHVKDVGIGPVAVVAQDGHDQLRAAQTFRVVGLHGLGVEEAFHVDAVGIGVQGLLVALGQGQGGVEGQGLAAGNGDQVHGIQVGLIGLGQQIHGNGQLRAVVGDDLHVQRVNRAVAVDVRIGQMPAGDDFHTLHMAQQHPGIGGGNGAVVVEVILQEASGGVAFHGDLGFQGQRRGSQELVSAGHGHVLGHDGAGEFIGHGAAGQVGDLEVEIIHAGLGRIVTQLRLGTGLAGVGVGEVDRGGGGLHQVSQACALPSGRVLDGIAVQNGICGAHQQVGTRRCSAPVIWG